MIVWNKKNGNKPYDDDLYKDYQCNNLPPSVILGLIQKKVQLDIFIPKTKIIGH